MTKRAPLIAGNWKMYKTVEEALSFFDTLLEKRLGNPVYIAVPFTAIEACAVKTKGSFICIGAQNMNDASEGAFTGEIAAPMLQEAGASFVLLGHSERRHIFHEDNAFINKKVLKALESNLKPVLCVGETIEEREANQTEEVLEKQLKECLEGASFVEGVAVAYEPVWAIGTGKAATKEIAEEAHTFVRKVLEEIWGEENGQKVPLLYGGSVKVENAKDFLEQPHIDGLLVGGASLDAESFTKIIEIGQNSTE